MSSVKQLQILSQRIDKMETRLTEYAAADAPVRKRLVLSATDELEIVCGQAALILRKDGTVRIRAKEFEINASGDVAIKAGKELKLKGTKISEN